MKRTISILIKGKVQGVFYRQSTRDMAQALGITGTVRNQTDGSVYITACGTQEQLDELIDWCRKGPPKATITSVDWKEEAPQQFNDFRIAR